MGTGLMEPASKFSPQITCAQVHWQHRGCWGDWPSSSWVSCEECPTKKQVSGMGSVKIQKDVAWKSVRTHSAWASAQPTAEGQDDFSEILLVFNTCSVRAEGSSVLWAIWNVCQSIQKYLLDQIMEKYNVLSLFKVLLLLTSRHAPYHFLLRHGHLAFWGK